MADVGVLEALTGALGDALSEAGGLRFTRVTANTAVGVAVVPVESTFGWPTSGKFISDGVVHSYTGTTPTTLTGVSHLNGGATVPGLKHAVQTTDVLVDFSKTYSALDKTIAALFVDSAESTDLSIVGSNIGVERPVGLENDATFREVIKAIAYSPRGTTFALETALEAYFGAGNYEVYENFPTYPNTVFVRLANAITLATTSVGRAYLNKRETRPLNTGTKQLTATQTPQKVQGVRLAPELSDLDFSAQKPSVPTEIRYVGDAGVAVWTFAGTNEATDVLVVAGTDGGHTRFIDTANANVAAYYHTARIRPESNAYFELRLRPITLPSAVDGRQFMMQLRDGARAIALALFDVDATYAQVGFVNVTTGALIGTGVRIRKDSYTSVALLKRGTAPAALVVGGTIVAFEALSSFVATADNEFRFGCADSASNGTDVRVKGASFNARTVTDYWNLHGTSGDATAIATFDTNSAAIVVGDVGKSLRTYDAATKKNNGDWIVDTRIDADNVTLTGRQQVLAILETANPTRVRIAHNKRAFKYPDDVGKRIDLTAATAGANAGTYVIASVLDANGVAYAGVAENFSDTITVSGGPGFVTETEIPWKLLPNFAVEAGFDWELSDAGTLAASTLTLRDNPPLTIPGGYTVIVEAVYSVVKSAQLLADASIANDGDDYYPFYLPADPLGAFRTLLDDLTVAGVIPEIVF